MSEQRQRYNEEFKKQTVKFIQEQTKSVREIAEELDIPKSTLNQWLSQYRQFETEPVNSAERIRQLEQQLKEKERRIADVEEELAIVKKAVHIFSKPRN
ncbi:transposase [Paenibacillus sp. D51F]|uniref:transposase n=1 Tax=unclassified Paenibacillus TaxID=185978 RepID=UPI000956293D|nr:MULTISPECIES: transposase [unclassified Paenibacillus]ASS67055.1 transposase [Paenibacillus sp. RUD330]ASS68103.1 transposase [Paenibacillus sp. RUD330]ASS68640.1 transposase [Paenibacillus sp. RUD330]SIR72135.1 transposase [Paenibacillus sp. RU4X]SIR79505.1 transposase [Paenibacillus sp. RU4T]